MKVKDNLTGRWHKGGDIYAAERLVQLKKRKDPWTVIEEIVKIWSNKYPTHYKSHIISVENLRQTRKNPKYASVHDKKNDGYLRFTLDIPEKIMQMIRAIYSPQELPMNRRFFQTWAQRFPKMKVAEKL